MCPDFWLRVTRNMHRSLLISYRHRAICKGQGRQGIFAGSYALSADGSRVYVRLWYWSIIIGWRFTEKTNETAKNLTNDSKEDSADSGTSSAASHNGSWYYNAENFDGSFLRSDPRAKNKLKFITHDLCLFAQYCDRMRVI